MNKMQLLLCLAVLGLGCVPPSTSKDAYSSQLASQSIQVEIDKRFELISIACRLAEFPEYCQATNHDYRIAVDAHFGPFKSHKAVQLLQKFRANGIGYDALPHLAIRIQDSSHLKPIQPLDEAHGLDPRWHPGDAEAFLQELDNFAKDSKAEGFFQAQSPFYANLKKACQEGLLSHLDQAWFLRTFGVSKRDSFHLCVTPLNGWANYGVTVPNAVGGQDRFAFMATAKADAGQIPIFTTAFLPTLVHEFLHGYTNPWVERHWAELSPSGETLNSPVAEAMRREAYGNTQTVLFESLVRAFTIRYFREHGQEAVAQQQEALHESKGFYWVKHLAEVLSEFTSKRDLYPSFEAFSSRLVEAFQALAVEAPKEKSNSA
jgi:hypothetical protein